MDRMEQIVSNLTNVDRENFSAFYAREFVAMVSLAASVSGDASIAEDLAQEAFHKASDRWSEISNYDKPGTWVRRVVINLGLNRKRRIAREAAAILRLQPAGVACLPSEPDPEVWDAVAKLPGKQRAAVALFYQEDRSAAEIAEILECTESTARAHLFKARTTLARLLGETAGNEPNQLVPAE